MHACRGRQAKPTAIGFFLLRQTHTQFTTHTAFPLLVLLRLPSLCLSSLFASISCLLYDIALGSSPLFPSATTLEKKKRTPRWPIKKTSHELRLHRQSFLQTGLQVFQRARARARTPTLAATTTTITTAPFSLRTPLRRHSTPLPSRPL